MENIGPRGNALLRKQENETSGPENRDYSATDGSFWVHRRRQPAPAIRPPSPPPPSPGGRASASTPWPARWRPGCPPGWRQASWRAPRTSRPSSLAGQGGPPLSAPQGIWICTRGGAEVLWEILCKPPNATPVANSPGAWFGNRIKTSNLKWWPTRICFNWQIWGQKLYWETCCFWLGFCSLFTKSVTACINC